MGWEDCHLHQFRKDGVCYGNDGDCEWEDDRVKHEQNYELCDLLKREKDSCLYEYDFGDGWLHKIILEKLLPIDTSSKLVECIKGKRRACPPEDSGGIWGYERMIETINDASHSECQEVLAWLGESFDPEYFNLDEINQALSKFMK